MRFYKHKVASDGVHSASHGVTADGMFFAEQTEARLERRFVPAVARGRWGRSGWAAWGVCVAVAIAGSPPVLAAERTVLCEEFTNLW
jgi:hypothetical protein